MLSLSLHDKQILGGIVAMSEVIRHDGVVDSIEGGCIHVRIVQASACAACGAKSLCSAAESKEKIVDVYGADSAAHQVGQKVVVEGATAMGMRAVRLAFLFPLLLLVGAIALTVWLTGGSEALAALVALVVVVLYYLVLFACKDRLRTEFTFTIKPI